MIIKYILIGILFMFSLDMIGNSQINKAEYTWGNRLAVVGLWPVFMAIFIYHFIKPKKQ